MAVPHLTATGTLPLGRYLCTERDIESSFVEAPEYSSSSTRSPIWDDWKRAKEVLFPVIPIHAVWFAGSFTTSKLDPGDLDVVFVVNGRRFEHLGPIDKRIVTIFSGGSRHSDIHGLKIDSYVLPWICVRNPSVAGYDDDQYYHWRGYWDDWWLRFRTGPKGSPPVLDDAMPRRGYLEVKYDEYVC